MSAGGTLFGAKGARETDNVGGPSGLVFWGGRFYIDASKPGADALGRDYPDCPAVNALTLALLDRLTHENATLEAKVALLKQAIADL